MRSAIAAAVISGLVVLTAAVMPAPLSPPPIDSNRSHGLFDELAKGEPGDWVKAKQDWAHHRWSQQDAFGALEAGRVRSLATRERLSPQDVLGVIDEGIRAKWPGPDGAPLEATVVPLKPRPMD